MSPSGTRAVAAALLACVTLTALSLPVREARAQSSEEEVLKAREAARALATEALSKMDAGKHAEAIQLLDAAEQKFHAPTHLLYLAQCHVALGHLERGASFYQQLTDEQLPNYAPDAFREAQRLGRAELDALLPRLARVSVRTKNLPLAAVVSVAVDGQPATPLPSRLFLTAGQHNLTLTAARQTKVTMVTAATGHDVTVEVAFEAKPNDREGPAASGDGGASTLMVSGAITLSIGGAALIVGVATGALSLVKVDSIRDRCPSQVHCDPTDEELADEARQLGDASTAMFVIGGAASVTGIILLAIPGSSTPTSGSGAPATAPAAYYPIVGPGFLGLGGHF